MTKEFYLNLESTNFGDGITQQEFIDAVRRFGITVNTSSGGSSSLSCRSEPTESGSVLICKLK